MKTKQQVIDRVTEQMKKHPLERCLDGRDLYRLLSFLTPEEVLLTGTVSEEALLENSWEPLELTEEVVIDRLRGDTAFAFEKALNRRGISAGLMAEVLRMWLWVLDLEHLLEGVNYPMYGLPIAKAIAVHFGFPNPIGDDAGSETYYDEDYYE